MTAAQQLQFLMDARPDVRAYAPMTTFVEAEVKYDGFRMTLWRDADGLPHATGRKPEIDLWPQIEMHDDLWSRVLALKPGTIVDGEIHLGRDSFATSVRSHLTSKDREVVSRLEYVAFGLPMVAGSDQRKHSSTEQLSQLGQMGFSTPERPAVIGPRAYLNLREMDEVRAWCVANHIEGVVFKQRHYDGWFKLKTCRTIDAVVYAQLPGVGKHTGRVGALMLQLRDPTSKSGWRPIGKVGTGLTDDQREMNWVGRVVEVQYDSIASKGKLRMPVLLRERDDKPAEQCTMEQLNVDA